MIIGWDNKADGATASTDSQVTTLPAANVQTVHVAQKWHTASGVKAAYLIFDMGAAVACSVLALLGTNFTPTGTVRIRASNTDPTVTSGLLIDTGALTGNAKSGYGAVYKQFASTTARYWRLDLADAAAVENNLRVGRVFLGPAWTPSVPQLYDWSVTDEDPSSGAASYGGQEFDDEKTHRRVLSFVLDYMGEAEMYGNAFALARANGVVRDVLAIPDINGAYLSEQAVFGKLAAGEPRPLKRRNLSSFTQQFTVRERL